MNLAENGFEIIESVYSKKAINNIIKQLEELNVAQQFGIREFLLLYPQLQSNIFNQKLLAIIESIAPECQTAIKSIYFDKPPNANWIVNWHQDLTINVEKRKEVAGFKNWRTNNERTIVQPTLDILESIFTIRTHLDDCTKANGALRIIDGSHQKGIIDIKSWVQNKKGDESICEIKKGGILVMKPLTLHSSKRTENEENRRVIHIEFCSTDLPNGLKWKEGINLTQFES